MMKNYLLFLIILVSSCQSKSDRLEYALQLAKDNRPELEQVLNHYGSRAQDSLKLKAAKYLIENMPSHYSYVLNDSILASLNSIDISLDSLKNEDFAIRDSAYRENILKYGKNNFKKIEDLEIITADFLIKNIEHSFNVWATSTWSQHLTFEDFCEYLLPYKIFDGQILDNWKEYLFERYSPLLSNLKYSSIFSNSAYIACNILNSKLKDEMNPQLNSYFRIPILSMKTLTKIPLGPCDEYTYVSNAVMTANGIPVGIDFTPQWPFRSLGHSWSYLHENTKKNLVFEGASSTVGAPHKKDHVMAKVYRKTFKSNNELVELIKQQNFVPKVFQLPFIEDITTEYLSTVNLEVKVNSKDKNVYLAVFNNKTWEVIAYGKNNKGSAKFERIGKNVLYLPVSFDKYGITPIANPFIIYWNGEVKHISPRADKIQDLKLARKFPLLPDAYVSNLRKLNTKIQAANKSDFSDSITFHTFSDLENEIMINPEVKSFRFWRALSAPGGHSNIAELRFYENSRKTPSLGKIIGTSGSFREGDSYKKEAVFDGDLLSFFDALQDTGSWVGMDFEKPIPITRIVCIMRGDGNEIEVGDEYELYYWAENNWVSLGSKIAENISVEFDKCPTGALFLLRDKTKGAEERIFTYENGKQVWW